MTARACMRVCMCVRAYVCVCVCVREREEGTGTLAIVKLMAGHKRQNVLKEYEYVLKEENPHSARSCST